MKFFSQFWLEISIRNGIKEKLKPIFTWKGSRWTSKPHWLTLIPKLRLVLPNTNPPQPLSIKIVTQFSIASHIIFAKKKLFNLIYGYSIKYFLHIHSSPYYLQWKFSKKLENSYLKKEQEKRLLFAFLWFFYLKLKKRKNFLVFGKARNGNKKSFFVHVDYWVCLT